MNPTDKNKQRVTIFIEQDVHNALKACAVESKTSIAGLMVCAAQAIAERKISFLGWNIYIEGKLIPLDIMKKIEERTAAIEEPIFADMSNKPDVTIRQYASQAHVLRAHTEESFKNSDARRYLAQQLAEELDVNVASCERALEKYPLYADGNVSLPYVLRALGLAEMHPGVDAPNLDKVV
jgi:hypothetical protein